MKIMEVKDIIKKEKVITAYSCDCCGNTHAGDTIPNNWHEFIGYHNSWGQDSCDSSESYISCSPVCYIKLFQNSVEQFKKYNDAEIDGFTIQFAKMLSEFLNKNNGVDNDNRRCN